MFVRCLLYFTGATSKDVPLLEQLNVLGHWYDLKWTVKLGEFWGGCETKGIEWDSFNHTWALKSTGNLSLQNVKQEVKIIHFWGSY